jgi:outer membrane protein TolC
VKLSPFRTSVINASIWRRCRKCRARRSALLTRQRYRAGTTNLIDLLDSQRAEFAAQQDVVSGQAELLKDLVSLQKSLGLGWNQSKT